MKRVILLGVLIGVLSVILLVGLGDAVRSYVLETLSSIGSNQARSM